MGTCRWRIGLGADVEEEDGRKTVWTVHGGGFFVMEKISKPDKLREHLHWFKFEALLTRLTGNAEHGAVPFATDGGNLADLGLDCVVCGPGSIDLAHRPDESIGLDELRDAVDFVSQLVHARCGARRKVRRGRRYR